MTATKLFNGSSLFIKISTSGTGNLKSEPISASGVATHQSVIISANIQNLVPPPPRSIPTIVTDETDTNIVMNAIVTINSFASALVSGGIV